MSELDRLLELNARLGLVPKGSTTDELRRNAAAFTNAAAQLLHADGWGRIRKPHGENVDGLDVDKLQHRTTLHVVDIVIAAGAPNARVGWQDVGPIGNPASFVEVAPAGPLPVPQPPPPGDTADALVEVAEAIDSLTLSQGTLIQILRGLLDEIQGIRRALDQIAGRS